MNSRDPRAGRWVTLVPRNCWIGAALVLIVAAILAVGVIPQVAADRVYHATPLEAAITLWVMVGCNLTLAVMLIGVALRSAQNGLLATRLLGWWAVVSLLLAFFLVDPAFGYLEHDAPAMRRAAALLFVCVAAELLGAVLALATRMGTRQARSIS